MDQHHSDNLNQLNSINDQRQINQISDVGQTLNLLVQESNNQTLQSQKQSRIICKGNRRCEKKNPPFPSKYRKVTSCQNVSLSATVALSNLDDEDIDYIFSKDDSKLDKELELCEFELNKLNSTLNNSKDNKNDENDSLFDYTEDIPEIAILFDPKLILRSFLNHKDN